MRKLHYLKTKYIYFSITDSGILCNCVDPKKKKVLYCKNKRAAVPGRDQIGSTVQRRHNRHYRDRVLLCTGHCASEKAQSEYIVSRDTRRRLWIANTLLGLRERCGGSAGITAPFSVPCPWQGTFILQRTRKSIALLMLALALFFTGCTVGANEQTGTTPQSQTVTAAGKADTTAAKASSNTVTGMPQQKAQRQPEPPPKPMVQKAAPHRQHSCQSKGQQRQKHNHHPRRKQRQVAGRLRRPDPHRRMPPANKPRRSTPPSGTRLPSPKP